MNYTINLDGPDGNAFHLLGLARSFGKQLDYERDVLAEILMDMASQDYKHLLEVFHEHFPMVEFYKNGEKYVF